MVGLTVPCANVVAIVKHLTGSQRVFAANYVSLQPVWFENLVRQLDFDEFANARQILHPFDDQAHSGPFGITRRFLNDIDDCPGQTAQPHGFHGAIAENKCDAEASVAGSEIDDGSLLEFQADGPSVFRRKGFPLQYC